MCAGNFMESFNDILRMEYTSQIFDKKSGFCITVLGTHIFFGAGHIQRGIEYCVEVI